MIKLYCHLDILTFQLSSPTCWQSHWVSPLNSKTSLCFFSQAFSNGGLRCRPNPSPPKQSDPKRDRSTSNQHNNPAPFRKNSREKTSNRFTKKGTMENVSTFLHLFITHLPGSSSFSEASMPTLLDTHWSSLVIPSDFLRICSPNIEMHQWV